MRAFIPILAVLWIPACSDKQSQPPTETSVASSRDWVPLDLVVVNGETGTRVRPSATVVARSDETAKRNWRSSTHVRRCERAFVECKVEAPRGFVAADKGAYRGAAYTSRYAERARLVAPMRREADVRVRVVDTSGTPVKGAQVRAVLAAGPEPVFIACPPRGTPPDVRVGATTEPCVDNDVPFEAKPTDSDGWTQLRGLPHLLDERFWIVVGNDDREGFAKVTLGAFGEGLTLQVRLPAAPGLVWRDISAGLLGGNSDGNPSRSPPRTPARLELFAVRRDGTPAAGARIGCGRGFAKIADEQGRVVFDNIQPGNYNAEVLDPDFVWSWLPVKLHDGESRSMTITEPLGWTAYATLLDSVGRRVPYASVGIRSSAPVEYLRVVDGVQDLALYTDANGDIALPRMHHSPVELTFTYGSRTQRLRLDDHNTRATARLPTPR
ncbi:MAG TPA: hypothetical protein VFX78_15120 [Candidatus Eisenbacteria bacterium]|nr:hypothetical protein [Candidatus Eisenbacteria bacterium]